MPSQLNINPSTIFCRDNLDILRGTNSECIDLIYLDPPFNKKKTFTAPIGSSAEGAAFSDIFREEDIKEDWVDSIRYENHELYSYLIGVQQLSNAYNYCYLVYMAIRLIECHRVLKATGSIYLHCDPTMSHYLKIVMDCIFGEKNFRNEIVWCYSRPSAPKQKQLSRVHDIIFWYSKGDNWLFNADEIRQPYAESSLSREGYVANKSKMTAGDSVKLSKKGKFPESWIYLSPLKGNSKEYTGYPTQKPLKLLERIISASSKKGDIVLDPFCGCATTCVAAEMLGRQWIGVDRSHKAYDLVRERLVKVVSADLMRGEPSLQTEVPERTDTNADFAAGNVYVISNKSWPNMYKVGIASNVQRRLNSYQTSDPARAYVLEYELSTPHYKEIEKHIHATFKGSHEWVTARDFVEIIEAIESY